MRLQVQRQLAQALFKLSVEFRKEETRFLNKMEAQKGLAAGSSIGLIEDEGHGGLGEHDPGFTAAQIQKVGGVVTGCVFVDVHSLCQRQFCTIARTLQPHTHCACAAPPGAGVTG